MYNTLIKISEELKQNAIVKRCIERMEEIHNKAYTMKWNGKFIQAEELANSTKESLMYEYPIYMLYVSCCLLIKQWDYGKFNTNYNTEVTNFIKKCNKYKLAT